MTFDISTVRHINTLATFLAANEAPPIDDPNTAFILAGSANLHTGEALFAHLSQWTIPTTLVIAGGVGHSTQLLYDAVERHPMYNALVGAICGLPEARVTELILRRFWPLLEGRTNDGKLTLLVDDKSTNCYENALYAKQLLDNANIHPSTIVLVQDPTMSIRTGAGLRNLYNGKIVTWSTFIPQIKSVPGCRFSWSDETNERTGGALWGEQRFIDLMLGEIPRLQAYGPEGKGSIVAVDIPDEVLEADKALRVVLQGLR